MLSQRELLIFCLSLIVLVSVMLILGHISGDTYNWVLGAIMGYLFRDHAGELRRLTRKEDTDAK
jgi:hypothetical protein